METVAIFILMFYLLFFHTIHAAELDTISYSQFLTDEDTLVSETEVFELGFFQPEGSENRYVGIWFKKVSVRTVVWVANRERPLQGALPQILKIVYPGSLALFNNNSMIWSSNTSTTSGNATAKLHDNGNLVLMDQQEKVLWQSFDYPTDTQLPGMKIGRDYLKGIEWRLSSWKSSQDPAPSAITWAADLNGYPESKLKQDVAVKFRGGPWSNQRFPGLLKFNRTFNLTYNAVITKNETSWSYTVENNSFLSRLTLNSSGQLQNFGWIDETKSWQLSVALPMDVCDTYNICGTYGSCSVNTYNTCGPSESCSVNLVRQSCACIDEKRFVPRDEKGWEAADWSGGCVRRTPLDCVTGSEGFFKYSNVKLPDAHNTWFNMSMTLQECKARCLKNCTCMAYANPDTSFKDRGCLLWFGDLIDIRVYPEGSSQGRGGQDIFVRMASSELVAQSISKKKGGAKTKLISLVVFPGVFLIGFISTWLWYAWRKGNHVGSIGKGQEEDIQLPLFSFSTIAAATASFSTDNILGQGGFGPVYKGVLEDGQEIAVKRLSRTSNQGVDEFKNEVICISKLQHRNLVKLLGHCIKGDEKLLIYEYMPNKSLDSFIFDENQRMLLDWTKRFDIIKGIARGLVYLHHDSRLRIIHRDLKSGNILLDQDMIPKISDFGLARSFGGNETQANTQRVAGTYGYMSPEYARDGLFSIKSDVFSFGVLVLEIVSGKKNRGFVHPEHDNNLTGHAWIVDIEGRSMELIDTCLAESCHPPEVLRSIKVGLLCVQQNACDRPNMSSVVRMLDGEGALPQPKQPAFFMGRDLLVADFSSSTNQAGSVNLATITELDGR